MSGFLSGLRILWNIVLLLKEAWSQFRAYQERARREKYKQGVEEKDTKKVEESFDSGQAGKPDKIGDIEWDDEKTK